MINQNLVIAIGALGVILIPTMITIIWSSWTKTVAALERNTHAIIKLETRLDRMYEDVKAWQTTRRAERIKNNDKDRILND